MYRVKYFHCVIVALCFLATKQAFTQKDPSNFLAESISKSALRKHVKFLSSDEMEGRENGKKGQKKAAAYIMQQFSKAGIAPLMGTYFQDVPFIEIIPQQVKINIGGKALVFIKNKGFC